MNKKEMKQIMLEDTARALKDEDKNEFINKISDVFREMVKKVEESADVKKSEPIEASASSATTNYLAKREYADKTKQALMENVRNYLINSSLLSNDIGEQAGKIVLEVAEKMIDKLPHKNFVGVQPMQGPVGLIYTLQYRPTDERAEYEEPAQAISPEDPFGEGTEGRKMTLNIVSQAVEAGSRKFKDASLSLEGVRDSQPTNDKNSFFEKCSNEIATNMAYDAYKEMKADLFKVAFKENETLNLEPRLASMTVAVMINRVANKIALKTRRGSGNFIITSKEIFNIIKFNGSGCFEEATEEEDKDLDYDFVKFMGNLNGNIKVFCDYEMPIDKVLVGYKGGSGETDAGYYYCPYIPVMTTGVVVNPSTFAPLISFMTRYGKASLLKTIFDVTENEDGSSESIATTCSSSYYAELTFNNVAEVYETMSNMENEEPDTKNQEVEEIEETHYRFDEALGTLELVD